MGGEFDRFAPVPVTENHDRVFTLLGYVIRYVSADPFRRPARESPVHRAVRINFRDVEVHLADLLPVRIGKADGDRSSGPGGSGRVLCPPARNAGDGRDRLNDLRDGPLDSDSVNDVHHSFLTSFLIIE